MNEVGQILVVDDSKSIRERLEGILSPEYRVETADSGEMALAILTTFKPDLLLLDVEMPGMNGIELCRRIRKDASLGFVKVIMISSLVKLDERLKGYQAGVDDYLGKPFKKEELLAKVKVFVKLKAVEDKLFELNNQLSEQVRVRTAQLIDAEKMAAIGRHTAGIVHNLNSPLQVIMGNIQLMAYKDPDNPRLTKLSNASEQMKNIIATLLTTSSLENSAEEMDVDLNRVIRSQIELLKSHPHFDPGTRIELELAPIPMIRGMYVHFSQSIGNLIKNASEAMSQNPTKWLFISSWLQEEAIVIQISDIGHGIPEEGLCRIFDPFYTTKPLTAAGKQPTGTGLGLASCKEMIESYGGRIVVESEMDKGTTFKVLLPST